SMRAVLSRIAGAGAARADERVRRTVDVPAIFASVKELYDSAARERGMRIDTVFDATLPPLEGDPERLRRVLLHLIDCAITAADRHATIAIRIEPLESADETLRAKFSVTAPVPGVADGRPSASLTEMWAEDGLDADSLRESAAARLVHGMDGT